MGIDEKVEGGTPKKLEEETKYFESIKEELLKESPGKYVAIKGKEIIYVGSSKGDVIEEVFVKRGERGAVLIMEIAKEQKVHRIRI